MAVQFNGTTWLGHWDGLSGIHVTAPVGSHHNPFSISLLVYPTTDAEIWWAWFNFVDHWTGWYMEHIGSTTVSAAFSQEELDQTQWNTKAQKTGLVLNQWNQIGGRWVDTTSKFAVVNGVVGPENTAGFHAYEDPNHGAVSIGGTWRGLDTTVWPWETHKLPGMGPEIVRSGNRAAEYGFWNRALTDAEWAKLGPVSGVLGSPLLIPNGLTAYGSLKTSSEFEIGGDSGNNGAYELSFQTPIPPLTYVTHPQVRTTDGPPEANRPTLPDSVTNLMSGSNPIPDALGGSTINVGSGANDLHDAIYGVGAYVGQGALSGTAHVGNTYVCPAGASYNRVVFPAVTTGSGYTCIRSDSPSLPAFGTRLFGTGANKTPGDESKLWRINNNANQEPGIEIPVMSSGWRFIGMEATQGTPGGEPAFGMFWIKGKRVCIERSWIHAHSSSMRTGRGVYVQSQAEQGQFAEDFQIWDSWIDDIRHEDADNQAIFIAITQRAHVENCHLEATCENIMLGTQEWGAYSEHITLRKNHFYKRPEWWKYMQDGETLNPVWDGLEFNGRPSWTTKNLLEMKMARVTLVEGNFFENMWTGMGIVINTQGLANEDCTVRHNTFFKCNGFLSIGSQVYVENTPLQPNRRHRWFNNLGIEMTNIGIFHSWEARDFSFEHNTAVPMNKSYLVGREANGNPVLTQHRTMYFQGVEFARHTVKHNILGFCPPTAIQPENAVKGFGVQAGTASDWAAVLGDRAWAANAIYDYPGGFPENLPPNDDGVVTYPSMAAAGINTNGTLTPNSPLRAGNPGYFGLDGENLGVDFDLLANFADEEDPDPTVLPPVADFSAVQQSGSFQVKFTDLSA